MSENIGPLISSIINRRDWTPEYGSIVIKIESKTGPGQGQGHRVAKPYDQKRHLPAVRIVYHTDETIAKSMDAYYRSLNDGWSTTSIVLFALGTAVVVGGICRLHNARMQRARGGRYKTVAGEEEMARLNPDDDSEYDSDLETPTDARRNPAKGAVTEGVSSNVNPASFVFRDSRGALARKE